MLLPKFDFHEPATLDEACQIMAEFRSKGKLIAGGTDLMVNMKHRIISPENLISISRLDELKKLDSSNGVIKIGAGFTVADLADSEVIGNKLSALQTGAKALGSPLIRNLATIGGNIGSARPAADLPPSLMAYNAKVVLKKNTGERTVSLDKFFRGPGLTEIQPDEILTEIQMENPPPYTGAGYLNLGVRMAQDCNLVNAAAFIALNEPDGMIQSARVVIGCVGPTHLRAHSAETCLMGKKPSEALFAKAGEVAMKDCSPIDDFRGSAEYKTAMAGVLTRRALKIAHREVLI